MARSLGHFVCTENPVNGYRFAEAYLVAQAERSGIGVIASFDKSIDRVTTVRRLDPA